MRRACLLLLLLSSTASFAEAGFPLTFCGESTCPCGAATCSCGEVCNVGTGTCLGNQAAFCGDDFRCAATCGSFICEFNVCVRGVRPDAGPTDGGPADGGPPDAGPPDAGAPDSGVDGGPGGGGPGTGCGCGPGAGGALAFAALALLAFGRGRAPRRASRR